MSYTRPIQVFTELKSGNKGHKEFALSQQNQDEIMALEKGIQDAITVGSMDRQINVTGIGELVLPPDRFSITLKCRATKDNFQDAKNSVTRRVDYIVQTLHNSSLKDEDYRIFQHASHVDSMTCVDCEVEAHFTDLGKCQGVANLLAEKLGPGVNISLPHCYHARGSLDKLRKQVGMLAIHNARQKALEMARVLHLSVGHALQVQELGTTESVGASHGEDEEADLNPSIQQKVADATVTISSKVSLSFQLRSSKAKKK